MKFQLALTSLALVGALCFASGDQVVQYNLVNVSWNGYSDATGSFSWDWTTNTAASCNIMCGGGRFYLGGSYPANVTTSSIDGAYDYQNVSYDIALVFLNPVTPTSGAVIDTSQSVFTVDLSGNGGGVNNFASTGGYVQAVPEPGALLGLAVGAASLIRRRKSVR